MLLAPELPLKDANAGRAIEELTNSSYRRANEL
jgi:hypothetical protein